MKSVRIVNYTKKIKSNMILDNINYTFEKGKIYGIVGRNGSGKTMLLRAICGLIFPDNGEVYIDDKQLHKDISFPDNCGVIIENSELLPNFSGFENLKILSKIKRTASDNDIISALETVGLEPQNKKKVKAYSLGMKQRLCIAQAIFENPELLLMDEPTNALDEKGVDMVRSILQKFRDNDAIVLIASHNKEDIEILADEIINISDGQIISN